MIILKKTNQPPTLHWPFKHEASQRTQRFVLPATLEFEHVPQAGIAKSGFALVPVGQFAEVTQLLVGGPDKNVPIIQVVH